MINLSRNLIITIIVIIGAVLIFVFQSGFYSKTEVNNKPQADSMVEKGIKVVSTKPSPLEGGVVTPSQIIEIEFNKSVVNDPARVIMEPEIKFRAELINGNKTMQIIPEKPYEFNKGYRLIIKSGYSSDSQEKLDQDLSFSFRTIPYKGI